MVYPASLSRTTCLLPQVFSPSIVQPSYRRTNSTFSIKKGKRFAREVSSSDAWTRHLGNSVLNSFAESASERYILDFLFWLFIILMWKKWLFPPTLESRIGPWEKANPGVLKGQGYKNQYTSIRERHWAPFKPFVAFPKSEVYKLVCLQPCLSKDIFKTTYTSHRLHTPINRINMVFYPLVYLRYCIYL